MDIKDIFQNTAPQPSMGVKDMIKNTYAPPGQYPYPGQQGAVDPFAGIKPQPTETKSSAFGPDILAEAQQTFAGGAHAQGSPQSGASNGQQNPPGTHTPTKGTVGNMIPPGWSSQAAK
jgi:hypothetical protein